MRVNVQDAKTHLSRYLEMVRQGQPVIVCHRNVPIASLTAIPAPAVKRRIFGLHQGTVSGLTDAFPSLRRGS
ncbi:MAG: type II toxin-antitoxin system Phd/YefM family antitoxin [Fimbriimonadaceae bacterium]